MLTKKSKDFLSSPVASFFAVVIAVVWTIPTFGLFISSLRTPEQINNTGWWTFFGNPTVTLDNYATVLFEGSSLNPPLIVYFVNSFAIAIPACSANISTSASSSALNSVASILLVRYSRPTVSPRVTIGMPRNACISG